ncbi:outer membrane protein TOM13-domain-containing protein [Dipodascopsis uninucleata]
MMEDPDLDLLTTQIQEYLGQQHSLDNATDDETLTVKEEQDDEGLDESAEDASVSSYSTISTSIIRREPWTIFRVFKFTALNLLLPFINGMMVGFGEIFANELGVRWGFIGAEMHPIRRRINSTIQPKTAKTS